MNAGMVGLVGTPAFIAALYNPHLRPVLERGKAAVNSWLSGKRDPADVALRDKSFCSAIAWALAVDIGKAVTVDAPGHVHANTALRLVRCRVIVHPPPSI
jgi:hypothetical protein